MRRVAVSLALLAAACGQSEKTGYFNDLSRNPVSVRGWIADVKGATKGETVETEIARREALFQSTSLWVENADQASGGIANNGAFVVLDVPPQSATIGFNAPGAETAKLILENVPGNADLFIPDIVLEPGGATILDPKAIVVRIPAEVSKPTPTNRTATIAGHQVPIIETPRAQMMNRREYPSPGGFRPVAIVK